LTPDLSFWGFGEAVGFGVGEAVGAGSVDGGAVVGVEAGAVEGTEGGAAAGSGLPESHPAASVTVTTATAAYVRALRTTPPTSP
jgi:hypothetical protein